MSNRAEFFLVGLRRRRYPMELATLPQVAEPAGFNFAEVRAAATEALESLLGQLGFAFNGRHRTRNVQLWTMGHARVITNEDSSQHSLDPRAAGAPAISALGFDVDSPVIEHVNLAQPWQHFDEAVLLYTSALESARTGQRRTYQEHIAFAADDLVATARAAKARELDFLRIPDGGPNAPVRHAVQYDHLHQLNPAS